MNGVDVFVGLWFGIYALRGYRQGYIIRFFATASTIVAWASGFLYGPWLARVLTRDFDAYSLAYYFVNRGDLQPGIQVASGGAVTITLPLPNTIVEHINESILPHVPDSGQILAYTTQFLSTILINLFCFGLIMLVVKLVLTALVHFFNSAVSTGQTVSGSSTLGMLLGLMDSCILLMALLGMLVPFLLIASQGQLQQHLLESRAVGFLVEVFYRLQPQLF